MKIDKHDCRGAFYKARERPRISLSVKLIPALILIIASWIIMGYIVHHNEKMDKQVEFNTCLQEVKQEYELSDEDMQVLSFLKTKKFKVYKDVESIVATESSGLYNCRYDIKLKNDYNIYKSSFKRIVHINDNKNYVIDIEPFLKQEYIIIHGNGEFIKQIMNKGYTNVAKVYKFDNLKYWDGWAIFGFVILCLIILGVLIAIIYNWYWYWS